MIIGNHREELKRQIDSAPDHFICEIRAPKRSLDSNRLYWAILTDISEQVVPGKAYEPSVWHEYLRGLLLPERIIELPDGSIKMLEPSTAELKQDEFSEYVEKVIKWAVEHEVKLREQ